MRNKLFVGLLIGAASTVAVPGFVFVDVNLYRSSNHFGGEGEQSYAFFNVSVGDSDIVSAVLSSPSGGITGGTEGSTSVGFSTFDDLRLEVENGSWTLTLGREAAESDPVLSVYTFEVDLTGLTAPESFFISSPANGSTDVPAGRTLFQWSPPSDTFALATVDWNDVTTAMSKPSLGSIEIGPGDSSFDTDVPGLSQSRSYLFFVQYSKEVTDQPGVSISTPVDEFSHSLGDFGYSIHLHNEAETVFTTVPEPHAWALIAGIGLGSLALVRRGRGRVASVR
jgi:hypothetical protein